MFNFHFVDFYCPKCHKMQLISRKTRKPELRTDSMNETRKLTVTFKPAVLRQPHSILIRTQRSIKRRSTEVGLECICGTQVTRLVAKRLPETKF